jgi:outer membrane lipoprotein carrier protein
MQNEKCGKPYPRLFQVLFAFFILHFALLVPWAAAEEQGGEKALRDIREVVKRIQARYEQTRDLQAEFKQVTRIEGFATPLMSSGNLFIKKPGRLRWDYREPDAQEIYVNGNDLMMYVPQHKQVLVGKLTQMAASQAPLQLLQGAAKLEEHFEAQATLGSERGEGGIPLVTLIPKDAGQESVRTVVRIVVEAQPKTYFIKTVSIHEVSGNIATFQFSNLQANTGLKGSLFEFAVPAGVEVVKAPALGPP